MVLEDMGPALEGGLTMFRCMIPIFALVACNDSKTEPKQPIYPALLGNRSRAVIEHFQATCSSKWASTSTTQLEETRYADLRLHVYDNGEIEQLQCHMSNFATYAIRFDAHGRIAAVIIAANGSDIVTLFERAVAPIVSDDVREPMRNSLGDLNPRHFSFAREGASVVLLAPDWQHWQKDAKSNSSLWIAWHLADYETDWDRALWDGEYERDL